MKVIIENQTGYRIDANTVIKNAKKVLKRLKEDWAVGVFFVSGAKIKGLNKKFRRKNKATDVLSFEMKEEGYLGDVIVSPEIAFKNSRLYKIKFSEEIAKLVVHGILHLLGYDHVSKKQEQRMFRLQERLLREVWDR